jgi:flavorubredoxin
MVSHFVEALIERGIAVRQFELATIDTGKLAMALVDAATVVIGSPAVLVGPHPSVAYAAFLTNALRPKAKFASIIGSYGWAGKTVEQLTGLMPNLRAEILEPVLAKGEPKEADFLALERLADEILAKHKGSGLVN